MTSSEPGPYRIAVVAELTGVPEPTLRAWERRYDVPTPRRTASGYRLYGEREVEQVKRMRAFVASGISAAEAAKRVARERRRSPASRAGDPYVAAREAILTAVARFDDAALDREVRRLVYLGPATAVVEDVIVPALREIGDRWEAGELSVTQEHLASQKLGSVLRDFVRLAPGGDRTTLVACMADEQHDLGALAVAVHVATWGLRPTFFGARTPPDALAQAVSSVQPAAVALSVTIAPERQRAKELAAAYASACGKVPWAVGGAAAAGMADLVRAAGGSAVHDVASFEQWMKHATRAAGGGGRRVR